MKRILEWESSFPFCLAKLRLEASSSSPVGIRWSQVQHSSSSSILVVTRHSDRHAAHRIVAKWQETRHSRTGPVFNQIFKRAGSEMPLPVNPAVNRRYLAAPELSDPHGLEDSPSLVPDLHRIRVSETARISELSVAHKNSLTNARYACDSLGYSLSSLWFISSYSV